MAKKSDKRATRQRLNLRRINDGLSVIVVLLSLYILLWPLLPGLLWRVSRSNITSASPVTTVVDNKVKIPAVNTLVIPKIKMSEKINEGQDISALRYGTWRLPKSSTPDKGGNTVIVGHRFTYSGKGIFYLLDKLSPGDKITLYWQKKPYYYLVSKVIIVSPAQINIEANTSEPLLTLYTCTPLWSFKDRLIVQAKPIGGGQ